MKHFRSNIQRFESKSNNYKSFHHPSFKCFFFCGLLTLVKSGIFDDDDASPRFDNNLNMFGLYKAIVCRYSIFYFTIICNFKKLFDYLINFISRY